MMNIGVLTYFNVANFGANLQAVSTYMYLSKHGLNPVFINYMPQSTYKKYINLRKDRTLDAHFSFVDKYVQNQTKVISTEQEFEYIIKDYDLKAVIIGSDAVLQHHPFISRFKLGSRKPIYKIFYHEDQLFPNLFWGCGFAEHIPTVMMSVSSQNSEYKYFTKRTILAMTKALSKLRYISVRDTWTKDMVNSINNLLDVKITPDPVFAFCQNAPELVLSKEEVLNKYKLPSQYILISLRSQSISEKILDEIKEYYEHKGIACVALTMPSGINFNHNFAFEIKRPLLPNDWFSLIKHSYAYIGSNMHPIVVSLHCGTPCVSIDNWGRTNFFNKKIKDNSSKVFHILKEFGLENNHFSIDDKVCHVTSQQIISALEAFPIEKVKNRANIMYNKYEEMMNCILHVLL